MKKCVSPSMARLTVDVSNVLEGFKNKYFKVLRVPMEPKLKINLKITSFCTQNHFQKSVN